MSKISFKIPRGQWVKETGKINFTQDTKFIQDYLILIDRQIIQMFSQTFKALSELKL